METVTLHAEDFKTVHNTLCELRTIVGDMERSMVKVERLEAVIARFEQGLADAYRQDEQAFDRKHDHYSSVRQQLGLRTTWSIYEVDDLSDPHPFQGALQLAYKEHWGDAAVYEEIKGDTWAALYVAADAAIRRSGDEHHTFIESFRVNADSPDQLLLSTGS